MSLENQRASSRFLVCKCLPCHSSPDCSCGILWSYPSLLPKRLESTMPSLFLQCLKALCRLFELWLQTMYSETSRALALVNLISTTIGMIGFFLPNQYNLKLCRLWLLHLFPSIHAPSRSCLFLQTARRLWCTWQRQVDVDFVSSPVAFLNGIWDSCSTPCCWILLSFSLQDFFRAQQSIIIILLGSVLHKLCQQTCSREVPEIYALSMVSRDLRSLIYGCQSLDGQRREKHFAQSLDIHVMSCVLSSQWEPDQKYLNRCTEY